MNTYKNASLAFISVHEKAHYADLSAFAYEDVSAGMDADRADAVAITWFLDHVAPTFKRDAEGGFDRTDKAFKDARNTYKAAGQQAYIDAAIPYAVTVAGQEITITSAQALCDKDAFKALEGELKAVVKERRDALNNVIDARWKRLLGKASGGAKQPQTWNEWLATIEEMVRAKQKAFNKKGAPTTSEDKIAAAFLSMSIVEAPSDL
jgi:hypothetical protein